MPTTPGLATSSAEGGAVSPPPMDAVFTWVDGTQPDYLDLVRRYADRPQDVNPERYRDAFESLRFSLRSLEKHAPWIRHVYLFTCRPQVPAWLRREHPKLRIVHHDEVMTEPGVLPTFNSNVIETYLHRLPGISDRFLYLNDDYFLGAPVTPADFFTGDGRMKVFGTCCGERFRRRVYERQLISFGLLEHGPVLVDRQLWSEMQERAAPEIAKLRQHRFRQPDDIRPDRLYRWHLLTHARDRVAAVPFWEYLPHSAFHKVRNHLAREQRALARIVARRPAFVCLNDDQGDAANPAVVACVRSFLEALFPSPSTFEQ